jgi:hypothetical protein
VPILPCITLRVADKGAHTCALCPRKIHWSVMHAPAVVSTRRYLRHCARLSRADANASASATCLQPSGPAVARWVRAKKQIQSLGQSSVEGTGRQAVGGHDMCQRQDSNTPRASRGWSLRSCLPTPVAQQHKQLIAPLLRVLHSSQTRCVAYTFLRGLTSQIVLVCQVTHNRLSLYQLEPVDAEQRDLCHWRYPKEANIFAITSNGLTLSNSRWPLSTREL